MSISLLENEKILKTTYPHPLSMVNLYLNWLYIAFVGFTFIAMRTHINAWISEFPLTGTINSQIFFFVWACCLLFPSIIVSFSRINWSWVGLGIFLTGAGGFLTYYNVAVSEIIRDCINNVSFLERIVNYVYNSMPTPIPSEDLFHPRELPNHLLIFVGLIGFFTSNSYRKSHKYYLTNRRILIHFSFISVKERDVMYSKVDDLVVQQGIFGRVFKFGTIIPISASGMGTGSDQAFVSFGIEGKLPAGPTISVAIGGGKSITIPRAPSFYSLYGVANPEEIKAVMLKEMEQREYGHTRRHNLADMEKKLAAMQQGNH